MQVSTLELYKEDMKFSAGHFTIFDGAERERLHGHNFTVRVALTGTVDENGLIADYGHFKRLVKARCDAWNEWFLLPGESPHLRLEEDGELLFAHFAHERIPFLKRDVLVLPVRNTSVEELARLICEELAADPKVSDGLLAIEVKVGSGPGQFGTAHWRREEAR
jgi:6-pyruvoyltetrahydropterin/6-carboxytetrahydropterin synthase